METKPLDIENCRAKLNPVHAEFLEGSESRSVPLNNEKELRIGFRYSTTDNFNELERFLQLYTWPTNDDPQKYVEGFKVAGVTIEGVWRQAFVSRIERMNSSRQTEFLLVVTLRRGWATQINWDEALLSSRKDSDGNLVSVPTIDDTASYNDASALVIRFPNISPYKIHQCMDSLSASTYVDFKVQEYTFENTYHKAFVAADKSDDGTAFVDLVLSRDRFTVSLYSNYGTITAAKIYRLYDVTRDVAQAIVDAWKSEGRSADITTSNDSRLCIVTLTDKDAPKDNLSTEWMKNACDQFIRYHFAWGYTKDELDAWIKVHDGLLNDPAVAGDGGADTQPITRRLSIRERGDGLFNAEIEERKFDNSDPTSPDFTITLPTGTAITTQQDYGWNFKNSEISADVIKDRYDLSAAAVGKTIDFRVTRDDDCSFDWVASIRTVSAIEHSLASEAETQGVAVTALAGNYLTAAELADKAAAIAGGARKRISLDVSPNDDETGSYRATVSEVKKAQATMDAGDLGEKVTAFSGRNVDAADLAAVVGLASDVRKRVQISLQGNDDNTFDYSASLVEVVETEEPAQSWTGAFAAGDGVGVRVHTGRNKDAGDLQTLVTDLSAPRVRLSISAQANNDGTIDYAVQEQHVQENQSSLATTGTAGIAVATYAGKNMDIGDITAVATGIRKRVNLQLSPNDDGTFDWSGTVQTLVETNSTHETTGTGAEGAYADVGVFTKLFFGNNADLEDLPAVLSAYRKRHTISVQAADDGSVAYGITEQQIAEVEDSFEAAPAVSAATLGVGRKVYVGTRVTPADLDTAIGDLHPSATIEYDLSVQGNEDGTIDYIIREITKQAPKEDYTVGTALKSVRIDVARNQDSLASPGAPTARGVTKQLQPVLGDDGSITYELRTITAEGDASAATTKGGTLLSAVTQKHVSDGVTEGDLDASLDVVEGTAIRWQLVINEDGSFNYVKSTAVSDDLATAALNAVNLLPSLNRYGYTDSTKYFENIKAAALPTYFTYTGTTYGQVEQFRINADGTYSGRASTRTYNGGTGGGWGTGVQEPDDVIADARSTPSGTPPEYYYTYRVMWDANTENTSGWIFRYKWEDYWTDDYAEAVNVIAGGIEPSSINKAVFANAEVWHVHTCRQIAIDAFNSSGTAAAAITGGALIISSE